jgi:hypothetical protein
MMSADYIDGIPQTTNLDDYIEPARCAIEFWDLKNLEPRYSYDSFSPPSSGALAVQCRVSPPGVASVGSFDILIEDSDKSLDFMLTRRANIVIIKAKKYPNQDYLNLIYGRTKKVKTLRPGGNQLQYQFSGVGAGAVLDDRIVNIQKIANPSTSTDFSTSTDPFLNDIDMQTNNLFKALLADRSSYVVPDETIQDQLNMSDETISLLDASPVLTKILAVNQKYVTASSALQSMLETVGADGGINSYNEPYLKWPNTQLSGITLKSWNDNLAGMGMELANINSYFVDAFDWELSWLKEDGFTNRFISQTRSMIINGGNATDTSGAFSTNGFVSLNEKDYALQIDPKQTRIQNLAVVIEKKGNGTKDPENVTTVHGHIVEDIDDAPIGPQIAVWDIPLSRVPVNTPTAMFLTNIVFTGNATINSSKKYWITIYNRGDSLDNTINWYTVPTPDGVISNIASRVIAKGLPWASNHNLTNGWEVIINNPNMLAFTIFDNFTHDITAEDIESQEQFGLVEQTITTPFEASPLAAQRYLDGLLEFASMPKMTTTPGLVTIPNNLFMPGILINIEDIVSGIAPAQNFQAELADLEYNFGGEDSSIGAQYVKVNPIGYYNWRLESSGF